MVEIVQTVQPHLTTKEADINSSKHIHKQIAFLATAHVILLLAKFTVCKTCCSISHPLYLTSEEIFLSA
jgi:hypothetical protein